MLVICVMWGTHWSNFRSSRLGGYSQFRGAAERNAVVAARKLVAVHGAAGGGLVAVHVADNRLVAGHGAAGGGLVAVHGADSRLVAGHGAAAGGQVADDRLVAGHRAGAGEETMAVHGAGGSQVADYRAAAAGGGLLAVYGAGGRPVAGCGHLLTQHY